MRLQVLLLGPLEVSIAGKPVRLTGRLRTLLLMLAVSAGRAVSLDRLAEATWGDDLPHNPRNSVHTYLTRLRQVLGADLIETNPSGYLLRAEAVDVDAVRFLELLDRAAATPDAPTERQWLREALALWRGSPFGGVDSEWLQSVEVPRLVERYLSAVERRVDIDLTDGRLDGLAAQLVELTSRHPLRESLVARLLVVLDRSGRRAEALERYEAFRVQLADELGADPGPELRAMHAKLLSVSTTELLPASADVAALAPWVVPRQLPVDLAGFVGREKALGVMDALLGDAMSPVVITAIGGAAGVGKTALAVHWAHRVADRFPDGQLYTNLRGFDPSGTPRPPTEVLRGFLGAMRVPMQQIPSDVDAQASLYRSLLAGKRMLVVLDNARDAEQVRPLLPGSPGCLVVVTSRDRLTSLVAGEGANPIALDVLSTVEARLLLDHRIGPQRVNSDPAATDEVINRCASLPLALTVVAARAALQPDFPLGQLAAQLRGAQADLSAFHEPDPVADLRAVFSWSFETISDAAARLFRLLGLHPGPDIGAGAAASLAGLPHNEVRPLLTELTTAHLIAEPSPGRYSFHDLLRAFAVEQAGRHETELERRDATRRMLDHYVHSGHAAAMLLNPQREPITLAAHQPGASPVRFADHHQAFQWCVAEHFVLLAMVARATALGFDTHAWQLAWAFTDAYDGQGSWHDAIDTHLMAIAATDRLGDRHAAAQARRNIARAYGMLSRYKDAQERLHEALELYGESGDQTGRANTHRAMSWILGRLDRHGEAIDHARQALQLFQAVGDRAGEGRALNSLGWMHSQIGEHQQAVAYCEQALRVHRETGNTASLGVTLDSLGFAKHHLGEHDDALDCYRQAVELMDSVRTRYGRANTLVHLGDTYVAIGDAPAARKVWRLALDIYTEIGHASTDDVRAKLQRLKR